jgi:hypothetical protein
LHYHPWFQPQVCFWCFLFLYFHYFLIFFSTDRSWKRKTRLGIATFELCPMKQSVSRQMRHSRRPLPFNHWCSKMWVIPTVQAQYDNKCFFLFFVCYYFKSLEEMDDPRVTYMLVCDRYHVWPGSLHPPASTTFQVEWDWACWSFAL